ncbi:FadR/GntR family transcriptional regulator [soil metagenome]
MLYDFPHQPRIRRRGIHSDVVRALGLAIVRGDHAPGALLPRAEAWALQLGVSRTVVREVTRVLAEKGLVESRPRVGTRVRPRSEWNLVDPEVIAWHREVGPDIQFFRDLSEVRVAIEATAARLAAERATPQEVARMEGLFELMTQDIDDAVAFAQADLELHSLILRATHNALLAQLAHTISEALAASRDITVRSPGSSLASMPLHAELVAAIRARDVTGAEGLMTRLVEQAIRDIETVLAARAPEPAPAAPRRATAAAR